MANFFDQCSEYRQFLWSRGCEQAVRLCRDALVLTMQTYRGDRNSTRFCVLLLLYGGCPQQVGHASSLSEIPWIWACVDGANGDDEADTIDSRVRVEISSWMTGLKPILHASVRSTALRER